MLDYTSEQIDEAVDSAAEAFISWSKTDGTKRAEVINALANALELNSEALISLADRETHLGVPRLTGELARTTFQLRKFASLAIEGKPFTVIDDPAIAEAPPVGRPDMLRVQMPLGPVAMFSASNFPFAFSVLGGDTASALAAGCTVIVKAHPAHPELSRSVYTLITQVLENTGQHAGVITFIEGAGFDVGMHLIRHPKIAAAAFTGSTRGGIALQKAINERERPIPFFGELGAVNPIIALPHALKQGGEELAQTLAGSIALGAGQFCTNPGTLVVLNNPDTESFISLLSTELAKQTPHSMLTDGMSSAYEKGIQNLSQHGNELVNVQQEGDSPSPFLAQVSAENYIANAELREEVFGPSCLIVNCESHDQILAVLDAIGGSLTVTVWGAESSDDNPVDDKTRDLVRRSIDIAGRVLFKGVPTGVAVTASQHHGGPFPSSTAPQTTSVGDAALERFLRPVCLQDAPTWLTELNGKPC